MTDPVFKGTSGDEPTHMISSELSVLVYRMNSVEDSIKLLVDKFDNFASNYPNTQHLDLILRPLKDDLDDLEKEVEGMKIEKQQERLQKERDGNTLKLAVLTAMLSPLVSSFATYLLIR